MAKRRNRSIWLWVILGLVFGFVAILVLAAIGKDREASIENELLKGIQTQTGSNLDDLAKLRKLLDDGTITEDEFKQQKSKLLN